MVRFPLDLPYLLQTIGWTPVFWPPISEWTLSQRGNDQRTIVSGMDSKSQIRELTTSELETVSGGMVTLDFGIVAIYLQFAFLDSGPMTGATICGITATVSVRFLAPEPPH